MEIKKAGKNKHTWFGTGGIILVLGLFILLSPTFHTASAEPPVEDKSCLIYAYTGSDLHYFLVQNNSLLFGNNITVEHNCQTAQVFVNGTLAVQTNNSKFVFSLGNANHNLSFVGDNEFFRNYSNVQVLPSRLTWAADYYDWQNSYFDLTFEEYISISTATAKANWASILSIVTVFTLVTMVYWHLINGYVDRNYCEEVVE